MTDYSGPLKFDAGEVLWANTSPRVCAQCGEAVVEVNEASSCCYCQECGKWFHTKCVQNGWTTRCPTCKAEVIKPLPYCGKCQAAVKNGEQGAVIWGKSQCPQCQCTLSLAVVRDVGLGESALLMVLAFLVGLLCAAVWIDSDIVILKILVGILGAVFTLPFIPIIFLMIFSAFKWMPFETPMPASRAMEFRKEPFMRRILFVYFRLAGKAIAAIVLLGLIFGLIALIGCVVEMFN